MQPEKPNGFVKERQPKVEIPKGNAKTGGDEPAGLYVRPEWSMAMEAGKIALS